MSLHENIPYIEQIYLDWRNNHLSVSKEWDDYFTSLPNSKSNGQETKSMSVDSDNYVYRQGRVQSLLWAYRDIGYLYAHLNPLGPDHGPDHSYIRNRSFDDYETLNLSDFSLHENDLNKDFFSSKSVSPNKLPLKQIIDKFKAIYCKNIGVEFLHIQNKKIRKWLIHKIESTGNKSEISDLQKKLILQDLIQTEEMEKFLGLYFLGQKRFSLEGAESVVPALHFLVDNAGNHGIEDIVIGTTHRGRLSILFKILNMSAEELFSVFDDRSYSGKYEGGGDVKYHIGYDTDHIHEDGGSIHISLVSNPSHLESVDPVVEGKARAIQDKKRENGREKVLPVLIHGDAAFCGQGVVPETLNLSQLTGYRTGGTVHIIINNQIGFTTPGSHGRSTLLTTDIVKMLEIPVFHVNGDYPEAIVHVVNLALAYRQSFQKDVIIDIFCYRKHGHNEGDEPSFTHPYMYRLVKKHEGIAKRYGKVCIENGSFPEDEQTNYRKSFKSFLKKSLENERKHDFKRLDRSQGPEWERFNNPSDFKFNEEVSIERLKKIAVHITSVPEGFNIHPKLRGILNQKVKLLKETGRVDWAFAESLAFGTLLQDSIAIRMSGQDITRGTFSQRNLTWWDVKADRPTSHTPLNSLPDSKSVISAFDSPLSEYSVLGFEYGYSLVDPYILVIWEAQFGDFSNGAQVLIDNYIVSAENKCGRKSGIVILLPHGYEGQGPDHSNGHLERFLSLCANDNIQVCNCTTPSQYFNLLRRQMKRSHRNPLVLMSPKSLLRHPKVVSPLKNLAEHPFFEVLDDTLKSSHVKKILFCSGKVYYDLQEKQLELDIHTTAIVRVEQLYPFPVAQIERIIKKYDKAEKFIWVQEEHKNYGAWNYVREWFEEILPVGKLQYTGRSPNSSTATGSFNVHKQEQEKLISDAFQ